MGTKVKNMMSNKTESETQFTRLVSFIRDLSGEHEAVITRETLIENDLGVTGDDAYELIVKFSKIFHVNVREFKFQRYFNDEPSIFDTSRKVLPLMVGHLEKAMIAGRLDEEVINS